MKLFILVAFAISSACAGALKAELGKTVRFLNPTPPVDNTPMSERKYINMDRSSPSSGSESRIYGGHYSWDTLLPYQVSLTMGLGNGWYGMCGGSILGNEWILTAAHCVDGNLQYIEVGMGSVKRDSPMHKTYASVIYFNGWNTNNMNNDIAILKVGWFGYNDRMAPISLPARNGHYSKYVNEKVTVSGWGGINDNGDGTNDLKYGDLVVAENSLCANTYGWEAGIDSKMCLATNGVSTCSGDSGGPLIISYTRCQIGIVSYGAAAGCTKGYPIGFTRVTSFLDWINDITGISW